MKRLWLELNREAHTFRWVNILDQYSLPHVLNWLLAERLRLFNQRIIIFSRASTLTFLWHSSRFNYFLIGWPNLASEKTLNLRQTFDKIYSTCHTSKKKKEFIFVFYFLANSPVGLNVSLVRKESARSI